MVAIVSARDNAGGWNDGSRLATVECLVDYHTLAIDDSVFVKVPPPDPEFKRPFPYRLEDPNAWIEGTKDKILVDGHYYSHRSPLPAVLLAGWYFVWQQITGYTARENCDQFCYWMNLGSAGLSYVMAVVCTFYLGGTVRLSLARRLALTASLAWGTVAIAYAAQVNDHIMLLAVAAAMALNQAHLAARPQGEDAGQNPANGGASVSSSKSAWLRIALAGGLGGLAYTIDQGAGPPLLLAAGLIVAYRTRWRLGALAVFAAAALPWLAVHHALNYAIGGTFKPVGSLPEYFDWPGTPFHAQNMTGVWNHPTPADFVRYALGLLFEPAWGFFWHNLPLLLTLSGFFIVWRRRPAEWPELFGFSAWAVMTWLLYSALSVNHAGDCCSVRWFTPLLAAGYYLLAVLLRDDARYNSGFLTLTAIACAQGVYMWAAGPWHEPAAPQFRMLQLAGAASWLVWLIWATVAGARYGAPEPQPLGSRRPEPRPARKQAKR
jgi:hypothetical protein